MDRDDLIARLRKLPCVMVEICEPHSGNPSPNIIPIAKKDLLAALESRPAPTEERAREEARDFMLHRWPWHLNSDGVQDQLAAMLLRFATNTALSRDEEGAVDREAVIEERARSICRLFDADPDEITDTYGPVRRWHDPAYHINEAIEALGGSALKTSTPETQIVEGGGL